MREGCRGSLNRCLRYVPRGGTQHRRGFADQRALRETGKPVKMQGVRFSRAKRQDGEVFRCRCRQPSSSEAFIFVLLFFISASFRIHGRMPLCISVNPPGRGLGRTGELVSRVRQPPFQLPSTRLGEHDVLFNSLGSRFIRAVQPGNPRALCVHRDGNSNGLISMHEARPRCGHPSWPRGVTSAVARFSLLDIFEKLLDTD